MQLPKKVFLSVLFFEIFLLFSGVGIPFFSNDPALYASISKTMVQRNDFINLYVYGIDWLDKPHFPFWMAAISFKVFGISEWAYRLPALLFVLLGAFYTYQLAKKLYNRNVAQLSVLILLSSQHLLMSNVDVRAEPYLVGLIIGSVYHFYHLFQRFSLVDLLLGSLFAGCAVMTKGIFALVPVGTAIIGHALFTKQFRELFQWRWLFAALLTMFFFMPEVYAVYLQFDRHPEKIVFDRTGVSGVKWFLWDSQFSRFVNNGPITRPKGDIFYYVHTLLWAYAPWCLLLYYVLAKRFWYFFKRKKLQEYLILSASLPILLFFSFSKFQLNFYTNILFPFFSILVASFIDSIVTKKQRLFFLSSQVLYCLLLFIGLMALNVLSQTFFEWLYFALILVVPLILILLFRKQSILKWFVLSCALIVLSNLYLNATIYSLKASLKIENNAAKFVNQNYPGTKLGVFYNTRNGFEFYSDLRVQRVNMDQWMNGTERERIYYVDEQTYGELVARTAPFQIMKEFTGHAPDHISLKFIRASTRTQSFQKGYLIRAF